MVRFLMLSFISLLVIGCSKLNQVQITNNTGEIHGRFFEVTRGSNVRGSRKQKAYILCQKGEKIDSVVSDDETFLFSNLKSGSYSVVPRYDLRNTKKDVVIPVNDEISVISGFRTYIYSNYYSGIFQKIDREMCQDLIPIPCSDSIVVRIQFQNPTDKESDAFIYLNKSLNYVIPKISLQKKIKPSEQCNVNLKVPIGIYELKIIIGNNTESFTSNTYLQLPFLEENEDTVKILSFHKINISKDLTKNNRNSKIQFYKSCYSNETN